MVDVTEAGRRRTGLRSRREDEAAKKSLPFAVKVPNKTTVKAMRASDRGKRKSLNSADALFKDLAIW
jgi:antitoxin component of RelBE/YafQ-DinJ toxin-antitoxin module